MTTAAERAQQARQATTSTTAVLPGVSTPPVNSDLQKSMNQFGVSATTSDPDDPVIILTKKGKAKSYRSDVPASKANEPVDFGDTSTLSEMQKKLFRMQPDVLEGFQRKLLAGGFYGDQDQTNVQFGIADEGTLQAWTKALNRAANYAMADQEITLDDVLNQAAEKGAATKSKQVVLPDPDQVRAAAAQGIQQVTGRVDPQLVEAISNSYMSLSSSRQQTANDPSNTAVNSVPDIGSYAESQARLRNPTEAGANDYLSQFQNFMKIIGFNPAGSNNPLVQ